MASSAECSTLDGASGQQSLLCNAEPLHSVLPSVHPSIHPPYNSLVGCQPASQPSKERCKVEHQQHPSPPPRRLLRHLHERLWRPELVQHDSYRRHSLHCIRRSAPLLAPLAAAALHSSQSSDSSTTCQSSLGVDSNRLDTSTCTVRLHRHSLTERRPLQYQLAISLAAELSGELAAISSPRRACSACTMRCD